MLSTIDMSPTQSVRVPAVTLRARQLREDLWAELIVQHDRTAFVAELTLVELEALLLEGARCANVMRQAAHRPAEHMIVGENVVLFAPVKKP